MLYYDIVNQDYKKSKERKVERWPKKSVVIVSSMKNWILYVLIKCSWKMESIANQFAKTAPLVCGTKVNNKSTKRKEKLLC